MDFLTTFGTPHRRYRWEKLPFGQYVSNDILQKSLKQATECIEGASCIPNDNLVVGTTQEGNDESLEILLERCQQQATKLSRFLPHLMRETT